jgi:hypothetical protein
MGRRYRSPGPTVPASERESATDVRLDGDEMARTPTTVTPGHAMKTYIRLSAHLVPGDQVRHHR